MIRRRLIVLDSPSNTMEGVIKEMINEAYNEKLLVDKDSFYKSVITREQLAPTAVGFGIAIPHGKDASVKEPFVAYLRTISPFEWDDDSDENVRSVFMMGLPETGSDTLHLRFLAEISKKLMNEEFRNSLDTCANEEDAFNLLNEVNLKLEGGES